MNSSSPHETATDRPALRLRLLAERDLFAGSEEARPAAEALGRQLQAILRQLEPDVLGVYWPLRSEFNAAPWLAADSELANLPLALPFAHRAPVRMDFRSWDGEAPTARDDCGIPCGAGPVIVPDVVLVPCIGYTANGHRLGYGGGYFDRWLALNPAVTTVGIAWAFSELPPGAYAALPHDRPLTLIVTERGVN